MRGRYAAYNSLDVVLSSDGKGRPVYGRRLKSRRVERLKTVSDPEDRLDVLVRIHAQLFTQPPDVHVQGSRADLGAVTPDLHEQRFPRHDFGGVLHQQRE